jgi:hypothetical protein
VGSSGSRINLKNAIVANNGGYGIYNRLGNIGSQDPTRFTNVTVVNNSLKRNENQLQSSDNKNSIDIDLKDTIMAGMGEEDFTTNTLTLFAGGTLSLTNTAIVTDGPFTLATDPIVLRTTKATGETDPPTVVGTAITSEDPGFINTTDPMAPAFYAVTNPAYGALNSLGGPLAGGSVYLPGAGVSDWSVY